MIPDPKGDPEEGEDGVRRGILEGEMMTDGPSLTTVAGAAAAFFLAESFLNKGLHRKVEIAINLVGGTDTTEIKIHV